MRRNCDTVDFEQWEEILDGRCICFAEKWKSHDFVGLSANAVTTTRARGHDFNPEWYWLA